MFCYNGNKADAVCHKGISTSDVKCNKVHTYPKCSKITSLNHRPCRIQWNEMKSHRYSGRVETAIATYGLHLSSYGRRLEGSNATEGIVEFAVSEEQVEGLLVQLLAAPETRVHFEIETGDSSVINGAYSSTVSFWSDDEMASVVMKGTLSWGSECVPTTWQIVREDGLYYLQILENGQCSSSSTRARQLATSKQVEAAVSCQQGWSALKSFTESPHSLHVKMFAPGRTIVVALGEAREGKAGSFSLYGKLMTNSKTAWRLRCPADAADPHLREQDSCACTMTTGGLTDDAEDLDEVDTHEEEGVFTRFEIVDAK